MNKSRCLYCYKELSQEEKDFHYKCSKKFFGKSLPPEIDFRESELEERGLILINERKSVTGIQQKLSLNLKKTGIDIKPDRLTILGISGNFIIKPGTDKYPYIAEYEDLTMHLAELGDIKVVPHSLIRMQSGNLAYITKRIDRDKYGSKIHMEDMCQLTERLTEDKYKGSYEQIAKTIRKFTNRELDIVNFTELILFSYITGNSDMHLKNFSLTENRFDGFKLTPAYDLLPSKLILISDKEDLALTLNGKKRNITLNDFIKFTETIKLDRKVFNNIITKFFRKESEWYEFISRSFLPGEKREEFIELIKNRISLFRK
ncbi:MAG: HipA domain-containing protein [Ignavibacteria bacterium]|nr:HipA domain-containing protein [Ignavibacteria bacterium]